MSNQQNLKVKDKFYKPFSWVMIALILAITFILNVVYKINGAGLVFLQHYP